MRRKQNSDPEDLKAKNNGFGIKKAAFLPKKT